LLPLIATIFTIIMYILFSTIFHDASIVGEAGKSIGEGNISLFGYIAYINFIFILIPLYEVYNNPKLFKKKDIYVGWTLLLISLLIFQALIFEKDGGILSAALYSALIPKIGKAGVFLIFLLTSTLSYTIIDKDGIYNILDILKNNPITDFFKDIKDTLFSLKQNKRKNDLKDIVIPKKVVKKSIDKIEIEQPKPKKLTKKQKERKIQEAPKAKNESKKIVKKEENTTNKNAVIVEELEENAKLLEEIEQGKLEKPKNFKLPPLNFLQTPPKSVKKINEAEIDRKIGELLEKLRLFKIDGDVVRTYTGPLVTTFEFKPAPNVKVSKILGLQDDLAMALSAETIRIQAPIPGRDVVGIEIPNDEFQTIYLKDILESKIFKNSKSPLTVALGKDIVGKPFVTDLQKLPHLLIAGTTGSGKSVGINAMILSLLYRNSPDDLKLILIDPKMLEFSIYNDIPHLLTPVIIEPKKAVVALANLVSEMERRYKLMAKEKVKNIDNYNQKAKKEGLEKLPFIVIIIDELADLMMTAGKEVEYSIGRLAQMARAAGIHIIVATQRPSVDVVTGLIKANLPARLSYRVGQKIDSKVILDAMGADALLGRGDALFTPPGITGLVRLHAPWNTEEEIEDIVEYLKAQQEPNYDESYLQAAGENSDEVSSGPLDLDPLYEKAKEVVITDRKSSISYLQRKLQIGYNRSANIVEQLEKMGVLSTPNAKGNREILI
jgi:S-DNA-T family DNA segregation ATPase FtsK/SpoIIIE